MSNGELQAEWYKAINPNGRVPAMVHVKEDGTSVTTFESAACLQYIVSEFDKEGRLSYPLGTPEYWTQLSWVSIITQTPRFLDKFLQTDALSLSLSLSRVAYMAGSGLRSHDGTSNALQPICNRGGSVRRLALYRREQKAQSCVGHAAGEFFTYPWTPRASSMI